MRAGRRATLLTCSAVVGGVLVVALVLAGSLWPSIGPELTQRTALPPAASSTEGGIPVPRSAHRCHVQDSSTSGSVRWCLPRGVSATTVARWYDDALPAGRDSGRLRWCVGQYLTNGTRRELWSTDVGLVGYELPPEPPHVRTADVEGAVAVRVVLLAGTACPAAARSSREQT